MMIAPANFELAAVMKIEDCHTLFDFLNDAQDQDVEINCAQVKRLSGLAAQLLLMGAKTWASNERSFQLSDASSEFHNSLGVLGLNDLLTNDGASA